MLLDDAADRRRGATVNRTQRPGSTVSQSTPPPYEHTPGQQPPPPPSSGSPYGQDAGYGQGQPSGASGYAAPGYDASGYGSGYAGSPSRPSNTMALVSLISGIVGLTLLPFIGSVVAVITGFMARKQIAQTGEEGSGLATAGLIMGWIGVVLGILIVILVVVAFGGMLAALSQVGSTAP